MVRRTLFLAVPTMSLALALACSGKEPESTDGDDDPPGACGEPVDGIHLTLSGAVVDADGNAVRNAEVTWEERNWEPRVLAIGTSDGSGHFTFDSTDITSVPDCWGTAVDYVLTASTETAYGEKAVNQQMYNAIDLETYDVDLMSAPIRVE